MIVQGATGIRRGFREFVARNWWVILAVLGIEQGVAYVHRYSDVLQADPFSAGAVGVLATVVGIFLMFRFNEAYNRWWEARILWGQLVNDSRSFSRQVTTLLTPDRVPKLGSADAARDTQRDLVYRHLAFCNALRLSLRHQESWEELEPFLSSDELEGLRRFANKPQQLIHRQGERLARLLGADTSQQVLLSHMDSTLNSLYDVQGGCERLKNTSFPDEVRFISRSLVLAIALAVPIAFLSADRNITPFEIVAVLVIVLAFLVVEQIGAALKNPFENLPNDTPMTALCRTIEIDLRQQLGETDVPPALEPVRGVLM